MIDIVAVSDLHGNLPVIPECKILLLGGDYCRNDYREVQTSFFRQEFTDWLNQIPADKIVGIAGNHDFALEDEEFARSLPWIYVKDQYIKIGDLSIWGSPWTTVFYKWAFQDTESGQKDRFVYIPDGIDIILSHGPAFRQLDMNYGHMNCGSASLAQAIARVKPKAVVCGHIHESRGSKEFEGVKYYNVTYCNSSNAPVYNPVSIEL